MVSSDPDRENTEDYIRNHFDPATFYDMSESSQVDVESQGSVISIEDTNRLSGCFQPQRKDKSLLMGVIEDIVSTDS